MDKTDKVWIYALSCPLSFQVKYVGKTQDIRSRFQAHLRGDRSTTAHAWLQTLKNQGLRPSLQLLEKVPRGEGPAAEGKWIRLLRTHGHDLTNKIYKGSTRPELAGRRLAA